jgi:hypothetical protein
MVAVYCKLGFPTHVLLVCCFVLLVSTLCLVGVRVFRILKSQTSFLGVYTMLQKATL